ncbi:MAG: aminoglycoside phosphotransferase family protein [Bacteroidota bacterium]|jgi:aminoglycoside 2''-phosphotransferase|nr:aminoglycoside phosphotransferase family protein [Bacteroidota bacterium]
MNHFENIRHSINHEFPLFHITSIKKIGEGDNNKAFLINQNYIFRFPKRKEVEKTLTKEIGLLPKIRNQFNLEIPDFSFISKDMNFVGYKSIRGEFLTPAIYYSLTNELQLQIQVALSEFLSKLHATNLSMIKECNLEIVNLEEEYSDDFKNIQQLIFPYIHRHQCLLIDQFFTTYLGNPENFEYTPALIHNDFSTDHILYEISTKKINGIIDFGDSAIGDPYYDFKYLLDSFGASFIEDIFRFYQHANQKINWRKLYFFSLANKLQIIVESIKDKDKYAAKDAYRNLEKWMHHYENKDLYLFEN